MTNKKATKHAFFGSTIAMLLCVAMLIGSTFAWFTDVASTGENSIQGGNLKVGLEYDNNATTSTFDWKDAENETKIFDDAAYWEPGYTEVVYFRIENKGSLAFRYQIGTFLTENVLGKTEDDIDIDLTKFLKFGIVQMDENDAKFADRKAAIKAVKKKATDFKKLYENDAQLLETGDKQTFAMVVWMPEDVDNAANHGLDEGDMPKIKFGVRVRAAQVTHEEDSFDDQYDKKSEHAEVVTSYQELQDLLKDDSIKKLDIVGGTYNKTVTAPKGKSFTSTNGTFDTTNDPYYSSALNVEENAEVVLNGGTYAAAGMQVINAQTNNSMVTINGGTYKGNVAVWARSTTSVVINGGTFNTWALAVTDGDRTDGHTVVVNGGTFNIGEGGIDAATSANIIIKGGTFNVDPTKWLAEGYQATKTGSNWVVTEK